ncbi:hypothetical protein KSP40_PGU012187 [Platanthera guangdongensis]|uniref:RNase H type-1 domain-containing protein n=1 Tax=Platanthera guangdongensis TaxID=2320717 RepID=A0ABR2M500_9ASPA
MAATVLENAALFDQGRKSGCWGTSRPAGLFRSPSWYPHRLTGLRSTWTALSNPCGLSVSVLWYVMMLARFSLRPNLCGKIGIRGAWSLRRSAPSDGWCCRQPLMLVVLSLRGTRLVSSSSASSKPDGLRGRLWLRLRGHLAFLGDFSAVTFQHVGRRANRASDYCAKLAVDGVFLWVAGCGADVGFQTLVAEDRRVLHGV